MSATRGIPAIKRLFIITVTLLLAACSYSSRITTPIAPLDNAGSPKKNITIAMLGATGMSGGYILRQALAQGYDVRALARTPAKLDSFKDQITVVQGNARDLSSIRDLLEGSDVVISALGPVNTDRAEAKNISTVATGHIIQAMQEMNIKRYILVSGAAVTMPGDQRNLEGWLIRKMAQIAYYDTVRDKQDEYKLLANSPIQWTIVRCPVIKAQRFQHDAVASLDTPASFRVRAGELADFILDQIGSREYLRKGPFLSSR